MRGTPFVRQRGKARVKFRRQLVAIAVVLPNQRGCARALLCRIEGSFRQRIDAELVVGHIPVHGVGRREIQAPGLHPALPAGIHRIARVSSRLRRQRLENVKDTRIAHRPQHEWQQRQRDACQRHATRARIPGPLPPQANPQRRRQHQPHQRAIGTQQRGPRHGKRKRNRKAPAWPPQQTHHGPQRQRDAKQRRPFGERIGLIHGRKRAQRGQPQRGLRGSGRAARGHNSARKVSQQNARQQPQRDLHPRSSSVVLHAEDAKARHQKARVARQTNQCGKAGPAG